MIPIALKDLRLFFADKKNVLVTFLLPIALVSLFAFMYGSEKEEGVKAIDVLVCDEAQTKESKSLVKAIQNIEGLACRPMAKDSGILAIQKGKEIALLVLGPGYNDSLQKGNTLPLCLHYDEAKKIEVSLIQQALLPVTLLHPFQDPIHRKAFLSQRLTQLSKNQDSSTHQALLQQLNRIEETMTDSSGDQASKTNGMSFLQQHIQMQSVISAENGNSPGLVQAVAGTAIMMLLFAVAGVGAGLLDEKQEGTLHRLLCAPIQPGQILNGKMLAVSLISILQLSVLFVYAAIAFGLRLEGSGLSLLLMIPSTAYTCSAVGIFLAAIGKSRKQIQGLSTLIILVMSCIGGSMVPTFMMPEFMQQISPISVNYWGIQGFYDIFWRKLPFFDPVFLQKVGILFLIGLILHGTGLFLFTRKNKTV